MKVSYRLCAGAVGDWLLLQIPILWAQHGCFEISVSGYLHEIWSTDAHSRSGGRTHQDLPLPEDRGVDDGRGKGVFISGAATQKLSLTLELMTPCPYSGE